ncbi:MAG: DUF1801 domain-containing protein [Weeksellaceae bacterium]|nr:DUF1801 domain-containing protein [Weeksellaceae bacterium]
MAQKTHYTAQDVQDFLREGSHTEQRRQDSQELIGLMSEVSGHQPRMWGASIIGFGTYHYTYDSGHSGSAPLIGFSPRKSAISLYVFTGLDEHQHLLQDLGKFKMGKACIYVNKLSDINLKVLQQLMEQTIKFLSEKYQVE